MSPSMPMTTNVEDLRVEFEFSTKFSLNMIYVTPDIITQVDALYYTANGVVVELHVALEVDHDATTNQRTNSNPG